MKKYLPTLFAASVLAFASVPVMAAPSEPLSGNNTTFNFSALCLDCNSPEPGLPGELSNVTGTLVLQDYTLGSEIFLSNFVSYAYAGPSNHVQPFTVDNVSPGVIAIDARGSLSGNGLPEDFFSLDWLDFNDPFNDPFKSFASVQGNWFLTVSGVVPDFGINPSFTTANAIPEPGSLALLGLGLAGLALNRKRKTQTTEA